MIVRLVLMGILALGGMHAAATDLSFNPNASEMLRMPPYCKVKFTAPQNSAEWQMWRDRMGQNFIDLHHYCAGLNYVNRYWGARDAKDRSYYLRRAMDNFTYMVKAEKPDFPLRAELYANRGEVFKLQHKPGEALRDYLHAIEIDPKLTRPYFGAIDLYKETKQQDKALDIAKSGLQHNPNSTALQKRYLELGGKQPFPEPIVAKVVEPELPSPVLGTPAAEETINATSSTAASPEVEPGTANEPQPTIGSPKNPYCRFCP